MKLSEFQKLNEIISTKADEKKKFTSAVVLSCFRTGFPFRIEQSANDTILHTLRKKRHNRIRKDIHSFIQLAKASQNRKSYLFSHDP